MIKPTIHLNGTSADELSEQLGKAVRATRAAMKALQEAAPNGRDYYPQGDGAVHGADAEHRRRVDLLNLVLLELTELHEHVEDNRP